MKLLFCISSCEIGAQQSEIVIRSSLARELCFQVDPIATQHLCDFRYRHSQSKIMKPISKTHSLHGFKTAICTDAIIAGPETTKRPSARGKEKEFMKIHASRKKARTLVGPGGISRI
jgi:hypothetical protein